MSNSAPLTRSRTQHASEDVKSASKPRRNNSTRSRPLKSAIKVFQDAVQTTPSKDAGSVRARRALQPSNTNALPQTPSNDGKGRKTDDAKNKTETDLETTDKASERIQTSVAALNTSVEEQENLNAGKNEPLSRVLARRLISPPSNQQLFTPVRKAVAEPPQSDLPQTDSGISLFATPPQAINYTDLLSPYLSQSKIPTLQPITNVADLFLPLSISPLALSQAYANALQSLASASSMQQSPVYDESPSSGSFLQEMSPPATNVSTHRLDRSPKAKMRYSPSRQQWFAVDEETGSPRVGRDDIMSTASPGSPTKRGGQLELNGAQLLDRMGGRNEKSVRMAQHVELGRGFPSPLSKGAKVDTPTKSVVDDTKDLDDVRRLREASLEFDFVRATGSPLSAKARNANVPSRICSDSALAASSSDDIPAIPSIPSGFAEFLAKTRVVSEPIPTTSADDEENQVSGQSASSRRRSKRKKAKLPVPEPESDPLSWDALQQKFVQAQVPQEYETIRSTYEKVAEQLEAQPLEGETTANEEPSVEKAESGISIVVHEADVGGQEVPELA